MGKQSKNNARANADRQAAPVRSPITPGPQSWKCVECSKLPVFRDGPLRAYWVGKTHTVCNRAGCDCTPKPGSKLFGGTYLPAPAKSPPGAPPSKRAAAASTKKETELQRKLDAAAKREAELQQKLAAGGAASGESGATASATASAAAAGATAASTTVISASGTIQAEAVKTAIKDLEAKVKMVERHVRDDPDDQNNVAKLTAVKADLAAKKVQLGDTRSPTEAAHNANRDVLRFKGTVK